MSETTDLHDRISKCNSEIETIKTDIANMEGEISTVNGKLTLMGFCKGGNDDYDVTAGSSWKMAFCNNASNKRSITGLEYTLSDSTGKNLISDLETCISNAWKMVRDLEDEIRRCQDRIAEIEAEEAQEAGR
ncbi:hypothetical protein SAMN02910298_01759 [Pseudobutyrivibrio sp. YE44]|uniref:hypothetical protein n=1 Tax=Pseudobutyrivibrio sp. YE44 TaxID=1520802 RepID=UPI0008828214|nr:hypothetical protein [Pseudobutyrivibrio sp. YE44]SDB35618.1 hypothetical protein SAMN02910298_01759 [Pseudobutyrivibrio sp. YE44]